MSRRTRSKKGGKSTKGLLGSAELAVPDQSISKFTPQPFKKYNSESPAKLFQQKQHDQNLKNNPILQSGGAALLKLAGVNLSDNKPVQEVPSFPASTASPIDATYNSQNGAQLAANLDAQRVNDNKVNSPTPLGNELKKVGGKRKQATRKSQKKGKKSTRAATSETVIICSTINGRARSRR